MMHWQLTTETNEGGNDERNAGVSESSVEVIVERENEGRQSCHLALLDARCRQLPLMHPGSIH